MPRVNFINYSNTFMTMRKNLILLAFAFLFSVLSARAQALLTAENGYILSLTDNKENTGRPSGDITADRDHSLYLIGPFVNKTGKAQPIRFGVEFKELSTGECFYKIIDEEENFADGLRLSQASFSPNFIVRNGVYEVRAVCMDMSMDASVAANWKSVVVPANFTVPQVKIAGEEPFAFFSSQPYVGNQRNVADLSDTKLYFSLTALSTVEKGDLYVFVYEEGAQLSIGYFPLSFSQQEGETKKYAVEYKKSGSQAANLEAGKTYELDFRFFESRKEKFFDYRYDGMKFSVVQSGSAIDETFQDGSDAVLVRKNSGRKVLLDDGLLIIEHGDRKYSISGIEIK